MFSTFFSMHSIGFLLRAKNTKVGYYVSLQTQGSVCGKWAAVHSSRRRRSSTLGWHLRVAEGGARRLKHGLVKQTQFCVSFIALWPQNGRLSNTARLSVFKSVFVPILIYSHESWVMTERMLTQVQAAEMEFLRRVHGVTKGLTEVRLRPRQETSLALPYLNLRSFGSKCTALKKNVRHCWNVSAPPQWFGAPGIVPPSSRPLVWHFATKCAALKFAEPWMSNHFSELRNHNYVSSAMYPEYPRKDWWGKSCWLNPRKIGPEVVQGPGGVTSSPTLLGPVFVWSQQNYLKLMLTVRFPSPRMDVAPAGTGLFGLGTFLYINNRLHLFI